MATICCSLRSSRFLSFSRQRSNKRAIKRASAWGEQKIREKWGRGEREGEGGGGGEERNRLQFYRTPFAQLVRPRTGAIAQFDWLVARQSKVT